MKKLFEQMAIPGCEREPGEHYLPTTAGGLKLTRRRLKFCYHFARTGKRAESARMAGFSNKNASKIANELLQNTQVKAEVERQEKEFLAELNLTKIGVLARLAKLNDADPRRIYNDDGTIKPPSEWGESEALSITGIEVFEEYTGKGKEREYIGRTKKVKLVDPVRPLELALKHFGLTSEKVIFPDTNGNPQSIAQQMLQVVFVETSTMS
jgi:phage terminase small subunit